MAPGPVMPYMEVGTGKPLVILQGFGTLTDSYRSSALILGRQCRVIVPSLFGLQGRWSSEKVLGEIERLLHALDVDRATFVAHSFGGGLLLEFANRHPERMADLVFADTLAMAREWRLAEEAARHPLRLLWMATPRAARDFLLFVAQYPNHLVEAAWWGFVSDRQTACSVVRDHAMPVHVLWASRDSLLAREDGLAFAADLGATFGIVESPLQNPVDHDWLFRHPWLVQEYLEQLKLWALQPG